MRYIRVAKDKPADPREQGIELAGINLPVPASPDIRVKQERDASPAPRSVSRSPDNDAPAPRPKRERIVGLREEDEPDALAGIISDPRKRSKQ